MFSWLSREDGVILTLYGTGCLPLRTRPATLPYGRATWSIISVVRHRKLCSWVFWQELMGGLHVVKSGICGIDRIWPTDIPRPPGGYTLPVTMIYCRNVAMKNIQPAKHWYFTTYIKAKKETNVVPVICSIQVLGNVRWSVIACPRSVISNVQTPNLRNLNKNIPLKSL
jgi:hypothetical protein